MKKILSLRKIGLLFTSFLLAMATLEAKTEERTVFESRDTLSEAVVTGTRVSVPRDLLPIPVSVVHREALEQSDQNVLMPVLMEQVPGLFVTSRGVTGYGVSGGAAGGISLRGLGAHAGRVLILIDGHPQYQAIYGHPVADQYIAADALRVEVSRGPSSVLYGSNAMGGAINIITRRPVADGNEFQIKLLGGSYGTFRGSVTDNYKSGRFTLSSGINYDRTDGHRVNSSFDSKSGFARLGYAFSDNWSLSGNFNLMEAKSQNPGTVDAPMLEAISDVIRGMGGLSLANQYARTRGEVNLYYTWGNHIINDGYKVGGSPQEYLFHGTDYMGGATVFQAFNPFKGNTLTAGFDAKLYGGNAYRNPTTEIYADHIHLREFAGYALSQQQLGKFIFNAGVRYDHNSVYGGEWVPQFGISFSRSPKTILKLSASKGFRSPNMRELYMYRVANEELKPERVWSCDFTIVNHFLDGRLNTELNYNYSKGDNLIAVVVVDGNPQNHNVGKFENMGVEASVDFRALENLSFNANYGYLNMSTPITGAPRHKFYIGADYRPGKFSFRLGGMWIDHLWLDLQNDITEAYVLVNARVSYHVLDRLDFILRGENLLAQDYQTMLGFPMPDATFLGGVSLKF
ncbi:MAG: TonB-dependent receptor [Candidatus Cryptobacteroides sp.]|jgi:outer membrane cobalamin receptor